MTSDAHLQPPELIQQIDRLVRWFPMEASIHEDLCMWAIATFWLGVDEIVISWDE